MDPVEISAGRLHLRPFQPSDADEVLRAVDDLVERWTRVPSPYTREDAVAYVERAPQAWADGTAALFAVLDATSGSLLASVGFVRMDPTDRGAEIGYWCAPWARGVGVTAQAVGAVCRWGFTALDLHRVEWLAEVGNFASRRVAEKAGFTVEGVLRGRLRGRQGQADAWVGSLLGTDPAPEIR